VVGKKPLTFFNFAFSVFSSFSAFLAWRWRDFAVNYEGEYIFKGEHGEFGGLEVGLRVRTGRAGRWSHLELEERL
jgi:hypothetical protein